MSESGPISNHTLLGSLPASVRSTIETAFEVRDVLAGEPIIQAGAAGGDLYIVESGWLDVLDPRDGGLIAQLGPGALLGELGFLRSSPANATVRATTDAVVHVLPAAEAERLARAHGGFALALGRVAAARVDQAPEAAARPGIFAVVEFGDWSAHRSAIRAMLGDQTGERGHAIADLPGLGAEPGTAQHLLGTRALGRLLRGPSVVLWTGPDEPQLSRALRSASRVLVLDDRRTPITPDALTRIMAIPADPEADVTLVRFELGHLQSGVVPALIPGVRTIRLAPNDTSSSGARELNRRSQVRSTLEESPIFGALPEVVRDDLFRHARWRLVHKGEVLYDADRPAGGLYLVLSGRVCEIVGGRRIDYLPGYVFGDDGLDEKRSLETIAHATRVTTVGFFERSSITRLMKRHRALRHALAEQSSAAIARVRTAAISDRASIAVVVCDHDPHWRDRLAWMQTVLGGPGRCVIVDREAVVRTFGRHAIESAEGTAADIQLVSWMGAVEERHRYLLYVARWDDAPWIARCLGQSEHLLFVADGRGDPTVLGDIGRGHPRHLALWWPRDGRPSETRRWLDRDPALVWHHVRETRFDDLGRMVRRMLGRAIGLVLGGASTRCVAHLGVVTAIRDAALPIDTFVGTSSGSAVAGLLCLELGDEETRKRVIYIGTSFKVGPTNVSPPFVSMCSGREIRKISQAVFGDLLIEDLIRPLKVTAVDLRTGEICVLDRGPIWQATRAACSVPGLWPPVAVDGKLLVDGGLLDNFPFFALERECAAGLTMVSNLDAGYSTPFPDVPDYGDVLSGWRVLWDKLLRRDAAYPKLASTVVECLVLGGRAGSDDLEERVDPARVLILRPPIPMIEFFGLQKGPMVDELIDIARTSTRDAIAGWQARYAASVGHSAILPVPPDDDDP